MARIFKSAVGADHPNGLRRDWIVFKGDEADFYDFAGIRIQSSGFRINDNPLANGLLGAGASSLQGFSRRNTL